MLTRNYLVCLPGACREIIAAGSPEAALRAFCRRRSEELGPRSEVRVELLDEALEREQAEMQQPP